MEENEFTLLDFKNFYKAIVIKVLCYWPTDTPIGQYDRIENPENNIIHLWLVYFQHGCQVHSTWNDGLFNQWCWEQVKSYIQKTKTLLHVIYKKPIYVYIYGWC